MTTIDDLISLLEERPDDVLARYMLVDALIEQRDMLRTEAEQRADRAIRDGVTARQIVQATALLADGADSREWLLERVRTVAGIPDDVSYTVVVIGGDQVRPPIVSLIDDPRRYWPSVVVAVGALRLIEWWQFECRRRPRYGRRRRTTPPGS